MKVSTLGLAAFLLSAQARAAEQSVVAVLGAETGPYREALTGFRQQFPDAPTFFLSEGDPDIPSAARVIVAFGSKAATRDYPKGTALVYAMAPGTIVQADGAVKICMEPEHTVLLQDIKKIQPDLKRLGVLWVSPRFKSYAAELREAAKPLGIAIEASPMENRADLPDHLRRLDGKVDAIWLIPDPLLISAESLPTLVEFSRSSRTPMYVSTGGLIDQGATAAIGPSFREMGRLAAAAARNALQNKPQSILIYPTNVEIIVSKTSAARIGLKIPDAAVHEASKVLP